MKSLLNKIESIPGAFTLKDKLSSSLISEVYECTYNQTKAVIRFDLPAASKLAIDRENEAIVLNNIFDLGISPSLIYFDPSAGIMIWKYIAGTKPVFDQEKSNTFSLIDLGRSLACIHSSPIPANSKNIFRDSMNLYESLLEESQNEMFFRTASDLYNELVDDGVKMVFSHNDLHSGNLIWNSKYYFLDWEFSSSNHPCFDIASLVRSFNLNENQIRFLSKGYQPNDEIFNFDVLQKWITFIDFLDQIWEIALTKLSKNL
jgi:thiamine kinase-like enzyme|tara:strand:+ start:1443 stop:2222 length:780 start_codon:yes stop_codon:yes gene_type:complete